MTDVIRVTAYLTSDGDIFQSKKEAMQRQKYIDIGCALESRPLIGNVNGSRVEADTLLDWLSDNKDLVMAFYSIDKE